MEGIVRGGGNIIARKPCLLTVFCRASFSVEGFFFVNYCVICLFIVFTLIQIFFKIAFKNLSAGVGFMHTRCPSEAFNFPFDLIK